MGRPASLRQPVGLIHVAILDIRRYTRKHPDFAAARAKLTAAFETDAERMV